METNKALEAAKEAIEVGIAYAVVLWELRGQKFFTSDRMEKDCALFVKALEDIEALAKNGDGWRPIESAPKDGTSVLAVNEDGVRSVIQWGKHNHVPIYGWIRWERPDEEDVSEFPAVKWQPLPQPPEREE